ncbi:MarR family winged helix-turn-helix transcriptional regulator [Lysobacter enzymogenes]|uniref:MarR family winged helix-turn-helix transcriptional regulator n=1 Tax=Lysobacter enzymogenes TaxID=69 RepID=UPI001AF9B94F|nr:MarR family transcriptional regulator [Lysobacter enzymogenes]QQQ01086.1 MarR family transcriptional regulator [Lysobacter enzymogenes]
MSDPAFHLRQTALGLERLGGLMRAQQWREPDAYALHPAQRALLELLGEDKRGWRVGELAQRLGVSAASASDTIAALQARELVRRERDPDDGRAVRVHPSRRGLAWLRRSRARGGLGERLLATLAPDELAAFSRSLQLLILQAQREGLATGLRTCAGCEFFRPFEGGGDAPHYCALVGAAFGDAQLRVDCAEHRPRAADARAGALDAVAARFRAGAGDHRDTTSRRGPAPKRTHSAAAE